MRRKMCQSWEKEDENDEIIFLIKITLPLSLDGASTRREGQINFST